jgi:RNA polymerase sigma factor (sigma-70 family)
MKITPPNPDTLRAATEGKLAALDQVLLDIQPGVFNLAVRMLGNRDDAADATQEILLKVVTHLGSFRGDAAFTTWVFQIARNHLLTASTQSRESPEVSLEAMAERLQQGLEIGETLAAHHGGEQSLTPEDKLAARQVALGCTQNMLMALDREQRLVYVLDTLFGLSSTDAAKVLDTTPAAYRQRLARTRARMESFVTNNCGLARTDAACHCHKQLPALAHQATTSRASSKPLMAIHPVELEQAERAFDALVRVGDAAAVFRAHPDYQAPESQRAAIRAVLRAEGFWGDDRASH